MDKRTGIRKYGRWGYGTRLLLKFVKYAAHCVAVMPLQLLAVLALISGSGGMMRFGLLLLRNGFPLHGYLWLLVNFLVSAGLAAGALGYFSYSRFMVPKGHILRPALQPVENPVLPDADLLVRASGLTTAQPRELLRAAWEEAGVQPAQLLRACE